MDERTNTGEIVGNIKNVDQNNINIDEKLYKNVLVSYVGYVTPIALKLLYPIIINANGYIEESNGNKYLTLVPTDES